MFVKNLGFEPSPTGAPQIFSIMLGQLNYWAIRCEQLFINLWLSLISLSEIFCSNTLYPKGLFEIQRNSFDLIRGFAKKINARIISVYETSINMDDAA